MTGSDVAGLISAINSKDGNSFFGDGIWGIIMLLIVAGIFTGGWGGNNNNAIPYILGANTSSGVTEEYIANQFNSRDVWSTNQNVSNTANTTQMEILNNRANCNNNYSNLRYENAVGQANIDKDILLGNQTIQSQMSNLALQNQSQMASCCCELKQAIHAEGEATRAQAADYRMRDLEKQVSGYELVAALGNQTNTLTSRFGTFYPNPPYPYYYNGTTVA